MARVGPLRRSLGRPTVFNFVGPLCNPAGATVQVIGVGRAAVRHAVAEAAMLGGASRVLVVSSPLAIAGPGVPAAGSATLDEVSLFGVTDVIDVGPGGTRHHTWTAEDFGLSTRPIADLTKLEVNGPEESATAIRAVLAGESGPRRDVVVLNAAATLWAAGVAASLPAARVLAERAIDDGSAAAKLAALAARSNAPVAPSVDA
jgi:anthranilate phosphoribosyltransferase